MRQPLYPEVPPQLKPPIPPGLDILMSDLAKEVLRTNPEDIYKFCAQHFERLLLIRDSELFSKQAILRKNTLNKKNRKLQAKPSYEYAKEAHGAEEKLNKPELEQEKPAKQESVSLIVSELTKVITNTEVRSGAVESNSIDLKDETNEQEISNDKFDKFAEEDRAIENEGRAVGQEGEAVEIQSENEVLNLINNSSHKVNEINNEIVCDLDVEIFMETYRKDKSYDIKPTKSEKIDEHSHTKNNVEKNNTGIPIDSEHIQNHEETFSNDLAMSDDGCLIDQSISSEDKFVENTPQARHEPAEHISSIHGNDNSNQTTAITKEDKNDQFKLQGEVNNDKDTDHAEIVVKVEEDILNEIVEKRDDTDNKEATENNDTNSPVIQAGERKFNESIETVIIAETSIPHRYNEHVHSEEPDDIQKQLSVEENRTKDEQKEQIVEPTAAHANKLRNDIVIQSNTLGNSSTEGYEVNVDAGDIYIDTDRIQTTALDNENIPNDVQNNIETLSPPILKSIETHSRDIFVENILISGDNLDNTKQGIEGETDFPKIDGEASGHVKDYHNKETVGETHVSKVDSAEENVALGVDSEESLSHKSDTPNNVAEESTKELLAHQTIKSSVNEENITNFIEENSDNFLQLKSELESEVSKPYIDLIDNKKNNSDNKTKTKDINLNEETLDDRTTKIASQQTIIENDEGADNKSGSIPLVDGNNQVAMENNAESEEVIDNSTNDKDENSVVIVTEGAHNQKPNEKSDLAQKTSDNENIANLSMDMETAAITIQKVFRSFLFRSKSSNPDESIDGPHSETEELENRENNIFETISELNLPISEPIIDSNVLLTRMNSVLQTVNEEKSSLSTDESSNTLSSAATKIQAHVRGFLVRNKYNSNKTCNNSSDTTAPSMGDDSKSLEDVSLNELGNEEQIIRITLTDSKLTESPTDDSSFDAVNNNFDMTLRAQSSDRASEARRRLKREDAIQSISPFSSSETPTIIQKTTKDSGSDDKDKTSISDEDTESENRVLTVNEGEKVTKHIDGLETENVDEDTLKHYPKTPAFKNNEATKNHMESKENLSDEQESTEENEFKIPNMLEDTITSLSTETLQQEQDEILQITITEPNNENIDGISSDEMDVVTPTPKYSHENAKVHEMVLKAANDGGNENHSDVKTGLVTTGEFHDVPLPTRVIRQNSSVVRGE